MYSLLLSAVSLALIERTAGYYYYYDDYYEEYENLIIQGAPDEFKYVYERKLAYEYGVEDEGFGKSVSVVGDRLLVGAYEDPTKGDKAGAAHIFILDSSELGWFRACSLVSNSTAAYDYFGWDVSLSDNFALIGAWQSDSAGSNSGAAYFFQKDKDYFKHGVEEWSVHTMVTGWEHDDSFGIAVALAHDSIAVVGAPGGSSIDGEYGSGYVSVFRYVGNTWTETDVIEASDASSGYYFGMTLALDSSTDQVVVGAYGHSLYGNNRAGMAYLIDISTLGSPVEKQMLKAHDAAGGDEFGRSVAILGNTIVVGATGDDDSGDSSGSVYIFEYGIGGASKYVQKEKLLPENDCSFCYFGSQIAMMNDTLVVALHGGSQVAGSVWIYKRDLSDDDSSFEFLFALNSTDSVGGDQFGSCVSIDDNYLVVGAVTSNGYDYESGAAYVYSKQPHYVPVEDESGLAELLTGSLIAVVICAALALGGYYCFFGHKPSGYLAAIDSSTDSRRGLTQDSSRRGLTDDSTSSFAP